MHRLFRSTTPLLAAACLWLTACDDTTTTTTSIGPTGNPTLVFADPSSAEPGPLCVEVNDDPEFAFPLLVEVEELLLRPPGLCGVAAQCGHLALTVDGLPNNETAVPVIDILFRKIADRYHDGSVHPGTGEPDTLDVLVEAVDDDGIVLTDDEDQPLSDSLSLVTAPACP